MTSSFQNYETLLKGNKASVSEHGATLQSPIHTILWPTLLISQRKAEIDEKKQAETKNGI